jgi:hypothetical protein
MGGGGSAPCDSDNASNAFENGRGTNAGNGWTTANDIIVTAGNDAMLNTIIPNIFMNPGATAASVDVVVYDDASGLPGAAIDTQLGVVPTSQTVIGNNFGFDVSEVTMDLAPVSLPGDAGSDTTYWIAIQVTTSDGGAAYWEVSTASSVGNPLAFNDGTGWTIPESTEDGVYTFMADCTPMGGGGGPCANAIIEVNQDINDTCMANISQGGLAQSYVPTESDAAGAGIMFDGTPTAGLDVDLSLWDGLPNAGGTMLASGTSQTDGTSSWTDVFWDPVVSVSVGTTYYIVIDGDTALPCIAGSTNDPYPDGNVFANNYDPFPTFDYTFRTYSCDSGGGSYDDCSGAIAVACGDSVTGETLTATDSGGNPAPDVFYKFTGSGTPQLVTVSLCAATDYDSAIRIFDDCDLANELAFNDDFCGLQSEVSFQSDGTSTYYIMVEGFGSSSGNFSLDVTCEDPLPNDDCSGAIAVSCGDSVTGSTDGATIDTGIPDCGTPITSPGVWYSLDDNSGLPGDITLSLCNGTTFDSKISVYTGDCSAPVCVDGNDDACGLQSEITFASDGNTSYLILIHSFGGATGDFTLDVTCTPTPPPNDMIVNSIDVDEIGFPYTDPSVAMPAATVENGNPAGCDLTGANGVWYNFVAAGDGTATASITTPGGASSVTFYTAPDENAVETDLTLVPQNGNQCGPGTSANIYTLAGQAYYVFVLNTGAVTDIVIDGTNLGVGDNAIEGFSYYPNPSSDVLNLRSVDNIESVSLYNMLGQRVLGSNVEATDMQLDVSSLSTGTYFMKVTVNGQIGTYKVLKD